MLKKIHRDISNKLEELGNHISGISTSQAIKILSQVVKHSSNANAARMIALLEFLAPDKDLKDMMRSIKNDFERKGPWYGILQKFLKDINPRCREKLIQNFLINSTFHGQTKRKAFAEKEGFSPPWFFVISPSMTCNFRCTGCYAGQYSKKDDLPFEVFDRVIKEGKELGIHFYTISGGEPFFRKDLLKIFAKHHDCYFLVYTNGSLIDKKLAKKLAGLGNVAPGISVEGFEKQTDVRRGKGTWKKIMQAMKNLRAEGVVFGFSATATRLNSDIIASEKFMDFFTQKGCLFGWIFQYIPVGISPDVNLMSTPEQRNRLRKFVHGVCRKKKPIFIGDFWNDGPFVGGCMAGGSLYLHINVKGDAEPCAFAQFAVDNVKTKSLEECLKSDFFKLLRQRVQSIRSTKPESDNLLTPCMIIDNPKVLRECVRKCQARPTCQGAETIIESKKVTKHLDKYSKKYHQLTDKVWEKEYKPNCKS